MTAMLLIVLAVLLVLAVHELAYRRRWFQPPESVYEHKMRVLAPEDWHKREAAKGK